MESIFVSIGSRWPSHLSNWPILFHTEMCVKKMAQLDNFVPYHPLLSCSSCWCTPLPLPLSIFLAYGHGLLQSINNKAINIFTPLCLMLPLLLAVICHRHQPLSYLVKPKSPSTAVTFSPSGKLIPAVVVLAGVDMP
jgi:hypothetical protein